MAVDNEANDYKFVMEFISASDQQTRQPNIERWRESMANFLVEPTRYDAKSSPYYGRRDRVYTDKRERVVL